jgi:multidrug transporter EmrE-like cation transporter
MAMLIWLVVLSRVEVSFAYAFLSLGFVLVTIAGWFFFGESLSVWRIGGIALVCGGLLCIAQS